MSAPSDLAPVQPPSMPRASATPWLTGLTTAEAAARLREVGSNDPAPAQRSSAVRDFLKLFLNPLVLILLIAAVSSAVLGDAPSAAIIIVIVLLSNVLDFTQTHRSQRAVAELQARVAPTVTVLRDGKWQEVRRTDIVPGDVVRLSAGDLVAHITPVLLAALADADQRKNTSGAFLGTANGVADLGSGLNFPNTD